MDIVTYFIRRRERRIARSKMGAMARSPERNVWQDQNFVCWIKGWIAHWKLGRKIKAGLASREEIICYQLDTKKGRKKLAEAMIQPIKKAWIRSMLMGDRDYVVDCCSDADEE